MVYQFLSVVVSFDGEIPILSKCKVAGISSGADVDQESADGNG